LFFRQGISLTLNRGRENSKGFIFFIFCGTPHNFIISDIRTLCNTLKKAKIQAKLRKSPRAAVL
jgi:hypothetical protein